MTCVSLLWLYNVGCCWYCYAGDKSHEAPFDCCDPNTPSKLLVVNIFANGNKSSYSHFIREDNSYPKRPFGRHRDWTGSGLVVLSFFFSCLSFAELLGVQESVALLAAVAQLDSDLVPPVCLEIGPFVLSLFFSRLSFASFYLQPVSAEDCLSVWTSSGTFATHLKFVLHVNTCNKYLLS